MASENGNSFLSLDSAERKVSYGAETADLMPDAIVVIIALPLANAPVTRPRNPDRIDANAFDAAPRTVDHAEDANPTRLANGALSQPIAADAIARMLDHAYEARLVTLDHADAATEASMRNGADTTEDAAEPTEMIAFHAADAAATIPLHTPRAALDIPPNTKSNAEESTLPGDWNRPPIPSNTPRRNSKTADTTSRTQRKGVARY